MANLGLNVPRAVSLRQQVTDGLRGSILSGKLRPGQKLIEREICEEMRISRTVLREALQHLEAEGMIVNAPPRGRVVVNISAEEAQEIYAVRQAIEWLVVDGFSRNATELQVRQLREKLDELGSLTDPEEILAGEDEFTASLLEGSGNRVAADILLQLNNRITVLRRLSLVDGLTVDKRRSELRALMSAIEARGANGNRPVRHAAPAAAE
ncbi:GntR family transcriptional regulator [Rhizobium mayense]|uniref:GntR family transcriptional regulator n=1 Tax=Rhizobium mayense TaxID=1312184 RepID=A0ABT7JPI3_9HYPH|nr:GntR family transcriptional regulator [Rhizobium mayense]MDL2398259.1 GntR family transcriptional regulator [Rhizobium mayense]